MRRFLFPAALLLAGGGCSTPPQWLYLAGPSPSSLQALRLDQPEAETATLPPLPAAVLGMAYDKNLDVFFLRLEPGNRVALVGRPRGDLRADLVIDGLAASELALASASIAVRWNTRKIYLPTPDGGAIAEVNLEGDIRRMIRLEKPAGPISALAYDQQRNRMLAVLAESGELSELDLSGRELRRFRLNRRTEPAALALDGEAERIYASLADGSGIGVFSLAAGEWLETLPADSPTVGLAFGPRPVIRVF
jgi:hypothetical protein